MQKYLVRRLFSFIPALLGATVIVFSMLWITPGDPVEIMMWRSGASAEQMEKLRDNLGLNDPLPIQYFRYIGNVLQGNFGRSVGHRADVADMIGSVVGNTIQLTLMSLLLSLIIGLPLGVIAAIYRNSWLDITSMVTAQIGISMPYFWFGLILIYLFSFQFRLLPATGTGGLERLILPTVTLAVPEIAVTARLTRTYMLEIMSEDYIRTARAKGLTERRVIIRHGLSNAAIPIVTLLGLQAGSLLGGAYIVEYVFARPGLGRLAVDAILEKDFQVAQGVILLTAVTYLVINLIVDVVYTQVDPRVRFD